MVLFNSENPLQKNLIRYIFLNLHKNNLKQIKDINLKLEIAGGKLAREALQDIGICKKQNKKPKVSEQG